MAMIKLGRGILLVVTVLGCGGGGGGPIDSSGGSEALDGGGLASCTVTDYIPSSGQTLVNCEEVSGPFAAEVKGNCPPPAVAPSGVDVQRKGQYADGPCSRVGLAGGCRVTSGAATTTFWYYETPSSSPDVRAICTTSGLTYIAP